MNLTSLGSRSFKNPFLWSGGRFTPSLDSESRVVKYGNPRFVSTMAVSRDGTSACNIEYTVFAENTVTAATAVAITANKGVEGGGATSSISESLIETLPGWRVDDFLDSSSPPSFGIYKTVVDEVMPFCYADLESNLGSFSSPNNIKSQVFVKFASMSEDEREEKELDVYFPEVVTKYKSAAEIINKALQLVLSECKPKAKIVDICEKGDSFIRDQFGDMYKNVKKKIERGVAFPNCVSVNNTLCHFSPLASNEVVLEEGDMVKICSDMGCHIDGFIAVVAHTHVLQGGPVTGSQADVIAAANTAAEVALRLLRPRRKNKDVTEAIQKVAAAYDCKIVEGVLSHQLKQFVIDGNKVVLSVLSPETRVDDAEFEENEVYTIDIVTSTGEGKHDSNRDFNMQWFHDKRKSARKVEDFVNLVLSSYDDKEALRSN
ncbi:unnamed protein product [Camellia sinensis]